MRNYFRHFLIYLRSDINFQKTNLSSYIYIFIFFILSIHTSLRITGIIDSVGINFNFNLSEKIFLNSSILIHLFLNLFTILSFLMIAHIFNTSFYKEKIYGMEELIHSAPIHLRTFLLSRFLVAFFISFMVLTSVGIGIFISSFFSPEFVGKNYLLKYFLPYFFGVLPNLFLLGSVFFFLIVKIKNAVLTYVTSIFFCLIAILFQNNPHKRGLENLFFDLIDPLGITAVKTLTRYWTVHQHNDSIIFLEGPYLYNRLIWIAVSGFFFFFTLLNPVPFKEKREKKEEKKFSHKRNNITYKILDFSQHQFSFVQILINQIFFESKRIFKSIPFIILTLICFLLFCVNG